MSVGSTSGLGVNPGGGGGTVVTPSTVRVDSTNGLGTAGSNKITKWNTVTTEDGSDLTLTQDNVNGWFITVNKKGWYALTHLRDFSATGNILGISVNSNQLTTDIKSITAIHRLTASVIGGANFFNEVSPLYFFQENDIIRSHTNGVASDGSNSATAMLRVQGPIEFG